MTTISFLGGRLLAALICAALGSPAFGQTSPPEQGLQIRPSGSEPSSKGPEANFTGQVRVDPLLPGEAPTRARGAIVTFEPGARTAWHTHPLGQTLIVTAGRGWVQREGAARQEMHPGDVVWIPPGVRHWHGATKTTAVSHMAIQEEDNGKVVDWMEKVSDDQYGN